MTTFREMVASDYQQVSGLWTETDHMVLREADSEQNITHYLTRNAGLSFVAIQNEVVVGAVLVGTDGRRGYLQHLAVSERCQGQGIGKQLVGLAVDALESQGIAKTHLFVVNENHSAQQFYQKLGWFPRDEVRMFSFNASDNLAI
ncbi:GNAT family N-acetyltransferase [Vibrio sinaloensis]|uniref:GNAT family N-acetyltransferase n=1 Tax=Photobacterium sp. (strain ATCC 43367) TaxID=379097 RepID=UPI0035EEA993